VIRKILIPTFAVILTFLLVSWGGTGHKKINEYAGLSFNAEMSEFSSWVTYIKDHASDPDFSGESKSRHYIDIDNYDDFITTGKIEQNKDAAYNKYTKFFVDENGTLPWVTEETYNYLVNCFVAREFDKAKQFAAELGHYVADGHMPLHITKNFNGIVDANDNVISNSGIHSLFESKMIDRKTSEIIYSGSEVNEITNIRQYIFDYIYANNKYVDSIMIADNYARSISGGSTSSSTYFDAMWSKSSKYTIMLFKNASHALAELIYTAWVTAGKPSLTSTDIQNPNLQFSEILEPNTPNPFNTRTTIKYNLPENTDVTIRVNDMLGNTVTTLVHGFQTAGSYKVEWYPENQYQGIYFLVLDTPKLHKVRKMMIVR